MSLRATVSGPHQRRSRRVLARLPVNLAIDNEPLLPAITVDISRHGGLILSSVAVSRRQLIWVQNQRTLKSALARVVRIYPAGPTGVYELGVEFVDPTVTCWGQEYDLLTGKSPAPLPTTLKAASA